MWPNHKRMCKLKNEMNGRNGASLRRASTAILTSRAGPDMRLSFLESDAAFFRKLFGADAHAHMPHLRRLAKRDFPREPGEHFVICIDYTDPAHPAGTCSLKNIHTYQFQTLTGREYDTANVDGQNQEMITMCAPLSLSSSRFRGHAGCGATRARSRSSRRRSRRANSPRAGT